MTTLSVAETSTTPTNGDSDFDAWLTATQAAFEAKQKLLTAKGTDPKGALLKDLKEQILDMEAAFEELASQLDDREHDLYGDQIGSCEGVLYELSTYVEDLINNLAS